MPKFSRDDAERMQTVAGLIDRWRQKQGLTPMDLLIAVRFNLANKYAWEEAVEEATNRHGEWLAYYDDGRHEESAADRRLAELEAEVARLKGQHDRPG